MKLEDQVCSLELSKRLKELGVKQESLWYWCPKHTVNAVLNKGECHLITVETVKRLEKYEAYKYDFISAFTVAELGEMLPKTIKDPQANWNLEIELYDGCSSLNYESYYATHEWKLLDNGITDTTEANARAKMLIYLIKNKRMEGF